MNKHQTQKHGNPLSFDEIANLQVIEDNPLTAAEIKRQKRFEREDVSAEDQIKEILAALREPVIAAE